MNIFKVITFFLSINIALAIMLNLKIKFAYGIIKFILDKLTINTKYDILKSYNYTWILFIIYNLYLTIFHYNNIIIYKKSIIYHIILSLINFIVLLLFAIYHRLTNNQSNQTTELNNKMLINKNNIIMNLLLLTIMMMNNIIIKPLSIFIRILMNVLMSNILHSAFDESILFGYILSQCMSIMKIFMFIIQIYIISILNNKIYYELSKENELKDVNQTN